MSAKINAAAVRPALFGALRHWLAVKTRRSAETSASVESNPFVDGEGHLDLPARERLRRLESFSAG